MPAQLRQAALRRLVRQGCENIQSPLQNLNLVGLAHLGLWHTVLYSEMQGGCQIRNVDGGEGVRGTGGISLSVNALWDANGNPPRRTVSERSARAGNAIHTLRIFAGFVAAIVSVRCSVLLQRPRHSYHQTGSPGYCAGRNKRVRSRDVASLRSTACIGRAPENSYRRPVTGPGTRSGALPR